MFREFRGWFDEDFYRQEILPRLSKFTVETIRLTFGVSHPYATLIRRGIRMRTAQSWFPGIASVPNLVLRV